MCKALENVSNAEWNNHKRLLEELRTRTTKWAGGLSVLSFFILAGMSFGIYVLDDISETCDENKMALAIPRYTSTEDDIRRQGDLAHNAKARAAENERMLRASERLKDWQDDQDAFRLKMFEFAAETRQTVGAMRELVKELKSTQR